MDPQLRALANQLDPMTAAQREGSARAVADGRAISDAPATTAVQMTPEILMALKEALVDPAVSAGQNVIDGNYSQAAIDAAPLIAGAAGSVVAGPGGALAGRAGGAQIAAAIAKALRAGGGKVGGAVARTSAAAAPVVAGGATALATQAAIEEAAASSLPNIPDLSDSDNEEAKKAAQQELKKLGLYTGKIDGDWGAGSRKAYAKFESLRASEMEAARAAKLRAEAAENAPEAIAAKRKIESDKAAAALAAAEAEKARASMGERDQARELQERKDALMTQATEEAAANPLPGQETKEAVAQYGPAVFAGAGAGSQAADALVKQLQATSINKQADVYTNANGRPDMKANPSAMRGYTDAYKKVGKSPSMAAGAKAIGYPVAALEYLGAQHSISNLEKERDRLQSVFDDGTGKKYEAQELAEIKRKLQQEQALGTSAIYNAIGLTGGSLAGKAASKLAMPGTTSAVADIVAGAYGDKLSETAAKATKKTAGRSIPGRIVSALVKRLGGGKKSSSTPAPAAAPAPAASGVTLSEKAKAQPRVGGKFATKEQAAAANPAKKKPAAKKATGKSAAKKKKN